MDKVVIDQVFEFLETLYYCRDKLGDLMVQRVNFNGTDTLHYSNCEWWMERLCKFTNQRLEEA